MLQLVFDLARTAPTMPFRPARASRSRLPPPSALPHPAAGPRPPRLQARRRSVRRSPVFRPPSPPILGCRIPRIAKETSLPARPAADEPALLRARIPGERRCLAPTLRRRIPFLPPPPLPRADREGDGVAPAPHGEPNRPPCGGSARR